LINNDINSKISQSDSNNIDTILNIKDENNQNNIYKKNMFHYSYKFDNIKKKENANQINHTNISN